MPENPLIASRLSHLTFTRAGLTLAALVALLVLSAIFVGSSEGVGDFNLNDRVVKIRVDYTEPCKPGTFVSGENLANPSVIDTGQDPNPTNPLRITVSGDIGGCLAVDGAPGYLLIADTPELFFYTTVTASLTTGITTGTTGDVPLSTFPQGQNPADWSTNSNHFPASGQAYIGSELVTFTHSGTTFTITARGLNGSPTGHLLGSLVRVQNRLKLVKRNGREYVGYLNTNEPTSGIFTHNNGATVRSPKIQLSCRARLSQTGQAVSSRSRCYAILEPGAPWGDGPVPENAVLPPVPGLYHELSNGTINDTQKGGTQSVTLTTEYGGITCFPYIEGSLWSKITSVLSLDTNVSVGTSDDGQFLITLYVDTCTTPAPGLPIGYVDSLPGKPTSCGSACINERVTQLDPAFHYGTDTDFDGCSDARELSTVPIQGGLRDPLSYWDYFNPSLNSINRTADITAVVQHYGHDNNGDPLYGNRWDRGGSFAGYAPKNLKPADNIIRTSDITSAVGSYGQDCPPSITGRTTQLIANGTDVNMTVGMEAYPTFETPLDWPNSFPTTCSPCRAYIESELVNYTRSGSTFTVTARGQSGTGATSHPIGSLVRVYVAP